MILNLSEGCKLSCPRLSRQWQRSNWLAFPRLQIAPPFEEEAYKVEAYLQFVGGPVYQTVDDHGGRQSTFVHSQDAHNTWEAKLQTRIVHYSE